MSQPSSFSIEYNSKAIRELVQAAFTDEEFWVFCYDYFPGVYQKFSTGMTYTHKAHLLIEYCGQTNSFDQLLGLVKEINPNKYAQFSPSLYKKHKVSSQQTGIAASNEVSPPPPTKIFISYSRKQLGVARRLAEDLQQAGFAVWWDVSDLKGGAEWERAIETAIKTSQYCLILLTPDSVGSEWVRKEYMYAISLHLQVIPILYRDCEIPLALTAIQHLDLRGNKYEQGLKELLATLESNESSKPIPLTLKDKLLVLARDPMWQMIGVIVAVVTLAWAVYTFYVGDSVPGSATLTPTITAVAFVSTPTPTLQRVPTYTPTKIILPTDTPTSTPTLTPTNTPVPPTETPTPTPTDTPNTAATQTAIAEIVMGSISSTQTAEAKNWTPTPPPTRIPTSTPTRRATATPKPATQTPEPTVTRIPTSTHTPVPTAPPAYSISPGKALFVFRNEDGELEWNVNVGPYYVKSPPKPSDKEYSEVTMEIDPGTYELNIYSSPLNGQTWKFVTREITVAEGKVFIEGAFH